LIKVDQLIATLTEAVLTFSELEALVTPLAARTKLSAIDRLKWSWKEEEASRLFDRLQRHKMSA
jgi:hypothetical protein